MSNCDRVARLGRWVSLSLLWLTASPLAAQSTAPATATNTAAARGGGTRPGGSSQTPTTPNPNDANRRTAPTQPQSPTPTPTPRIGDPLSGLSAAERTRFQAGKDQFIAVETIEEGIGPVFNDKSCVACHGSPQVGGGSQIFATRFGARVGQRFDPLIRLGGPVLQTQGIAGLQGFRFQPEVVPREATLVAKRRATPTFGFGLVDAVPDTVFIALAAQQSLLTPNTAGRVNRVTDLRTGKSVVGKFGWKAAVPNLFNFSGDAYKEELGVTTPGWVRDGSGRLIDEENPPQGNAALLRFNPVGSPNDGDLGDVQALADFMTFLAPPPRGTITAGAQRGAGVFTSVGCADCHTPQLMTGVSLSSALSLKTFAPYSDFLLHDMGALGDGIEQGSASGTEMRTAPLWGLRFQTRYLHDGRATNLGDAILQHGGQGSLSADKFRALSTADRTALLEFLGSL